MISEKKKKKKKKKKKNITNIGALADVTSYIAWKHVFM